MPSLYPGALDAFTNPLATDPMNGNAVAHAGMHTKVHDALLALQKELGVNPRGSSESVAARLATLALATHTHTTAQVSGLDAALAARGTGLATAAGTALASSGSAGTSTLTARQDHVHPLPTPAALGAAPAAHTHTIASVTSLQATLDGKAEAATSVTAGAGLTGGGTLEASRTLAVNFAGTGAANTVARSDHNHDAAYSAASHNHDTTYIKLGAVGVTTDPNAKAAPAVVVEASGTGNTTAPATSPTGLPVGTIAAIYL